jgi:hypothetical protein
MNESCIMLWSVFVSVHPGCLHNARCLSPHTAILIGTLKSPTGASPLLPLCAPVQPHSLPNHPQSCLYSEPSEPLFFGAGAGTADGGSFNTASRISLPGLNFTTERRGIGTSVSGRLGLRPIRALRTLTSKTPKFRNSTVVPAATASEM